MKWGKPSKPDLKDQMIVYLQEQIATKDLQIADLHNQLLALTKPGVYRMLHPQEAEPQDQVIGTAPIMSPRAIPSYEIKDSKWIEQVESRYRANVEAMKDEEKH